MQKILVCLVYQCSIEIELQENETIDNALKRAEWSDSEKFPLEELTTTSIIED